MTQVIPQHPNCPKLMRVATAGCRGAGAGASSFPELLGDFWGRGCRGTIEVHSLSIERGLSKLGFRCLTTLTTPQTEDCLPKGAALLCGLVGKLSELLVSPAALLLMVQARVVNLDVSLHFGGAGHETQASGGCFF